MPEKKSTHEERMERFEKISGVGLAHMMNKYQELLFDHHQLIVDVVLNRSIEDEITTEASAIQLFKDALKIKQKRMLIEVGADQLDLDTVPGSEAA